MTALSFNDLNGLAGAVQALVTKEPQLYRLFNETASAEAKAAMRALKSKTYDSYCASVGKTGRARKLCERHYATLVIREADIVAAAVLDRAPQAAERLTSYFKTARDAAHKPDALEKLKAPALAAAARRALG